MHSEKVPSYILDLLQQVPSVHVPGLGRFDAIFHPAVIDLPQSQIKPPYFQPDFSPRVDAEEEILPAYMHYVSGMDIQQAKELISEFVNSVRQRIETKTSYTIEKFGTFSLSDSEILHFIPDWDAFNLSFKGLEVIDLDPVQSQLHKDNLEKKSIAISSDVKVPVDIIEHPAAIPALTEDQNEVDMNEEVIAEGHTGISEATTRLAWIILTSALILITILCAYLAWDIISDRQKINQFALRNQDTLSITNEFDIPVTMDSTIAPVENVPQTNPVEQPTQTEEPVAVEETSPPCLIVVGAFKSAENVTRMVQRLEGMGYKSTQIQGGTLTRVAISTSCDKENLQKVLNEARSGINPESWIY